MFHLRFWSGWHSASSQTSVLHAACSVSVVWHASRSITVVFHASCRMTLVWHASRMETLVWHASRWVTLAWHASRSVPMVWHASRSVTSMTRSPQCDSYASPDTEGVCMGKVLLFNIPTSSCIILCYNMRIIKAGGTRNSKWHQNYIFPSFQVIFNSLLNNAVNVLLPFWDVKYGKHWHFQEGNIQNLLMSFTENILFSNSMFNK